MSLMGARTLILCSQPGPKLEACGMVERHTLASGGPEFKSASTASQLWHTGQSFHQSEQPRSQP